MGSNIAIEIYRVVGKFSVGNRGARQPRLQCLTYVIGTYRQVEGNLDGFIEKGASFIFTKICSVFFLHSLCNNVEVDCNIDTFDFIFLQEV